MDKPIGRPQGRATDRLCVRETMSIGSKLKELCKERGVSPRTLANAVMVSRDSIYSYTYDRCYPNAEVLHDIAKFFGVPMECFWDE